MVLGRLTDRAPTLDTCMGHVTSLFGPVRQGVWLVVGLRPACQHHPRYRALPSTTPECDSFFAKQACFAKRCVSHQALASSAVPNRSSRTVIQNRPS
ncbi:MAG: hypothetical protein QOK35_1609 [Pseudonocardiales bacterium]|nr:hypothetical protein [Pseudonocardiales bacterium]